ncbi:MAG: hypothetical protein OXH65_10170 [Paracoccaceae bacterium]|nr:hypothetical protein [Paracoccaceae bacterium]MDE2675461.1 hypothetical protein [Paracoccaceae bacterium]
MKTFFAVILVCLAMSCSLKAEWKSEFDDDGTLSYVFQTGSLGGVFLFCQEENKPPGFRIVYDPEESGQPKFHDKDFFVYPVLHGLVKWGEGEGLYRMEFRFDKGNRDYILMFLRESNHLDFRLGNDKIKLLTGPFLELLESDEDKKKARRGAKVLKKAEEAIERDFLKNMMEKTVLPFVLQTGI